MEVFMKDGVEICMPDDDEKSGKNITGRPEFTQMLHDVTADRDGGSY